MTQLRPFFTITIIVIWAWVRPTSAQDFFRVTPGKLTESHEEWDKSDACVQCHEMGGGVTKAKCLICHKDLAEAIDMGTSLHAKFKENCVRCHTDHKGRSHNIIDWQPLGGKRSFNHGLTGFALEGKHAQVACAACHPRRLKSGRTSYSGVSPRCTYCHKGVHGLTQPALLKKCMECHPECKVQRGMTAANGPFDHNKLTDFKLTGKHRETRCLACHPRGRMAPRKTPRPCRKCHSNPHGTRFGNKTCADCHTPDRPWKNALLDHDKTGYPLRGEHRNVACVKCHRKGRTKLGTACADCHRDPHRGRFARFACEECHNVSGDNETRFGHGLHTGFALTGKHKAGTCRSCHRGRRPGRFENLASTGCQTCNTCHAHRSIHGGQYEDRDCGRCHPESGRRETAFDHQQDTRFPLTGLHLQLAERRQCAKCHPGRVYRHGKLGCLDCHSDPHRGKLGTDCARCHGTDVPFEKTRFDHNAQTSFPLDGAHAKVECRFCHNAAGLKVGVPQPNGAANRTANPARPQPKRDITFGLVGRTCAECHVDPHEGRYGPSCSGCHNTRSFKEVDAAVHDTGAFRLSGVHERLPCGRCHLQNTPLGGLGDECGICHREDDAHAHSLGSQCGSCHGQKDWLPVHFMHAQTGFVLQGAHRVVGCWDCHPMGSFQGTPTDCFACHLTEAQSVVEPVHTADLTDCEECHNQNRFVPVLYAHPAYPLHGAHRTVRCSECHPAGTYSGTAVECEDCHMDAFQDPANRPDHGAAGFDVHCAACHNTASFRPARYWHDGFQRRGAHLALSCTDCHPARDYQGALGGLGWQCGGCHGPGGPVDRWPADHTAGGYPLDCGQCHSEVAFTPARPRP